MKTIHFILVILLAYSALKAQVKFNPDQLEHAEVWGQQVADLFQVTETEVYVPEETYDKVLLKNGLRSASYSNPQAWLSIFDEVEVHTIKLVFSKYPIRKNGYSMNYPLLCRRLQNLFDIDPELNSPAIHWEIVLQTHCLNDEQVDSLFHGVVIEYLPIEELDEKGVSEAYTADTQLEIVPVDTFQNRAFKEPLPDSLLIKLEGLSEAEKSRNLIDLYETELKDTTNYNITPESLYGHETEVRDFIQHYGPLSDSTVYKVFERNQQWKEVLVVADWTGSMYRYGAEASLWHILNFEKSGLEYLTLFNDGDTKPFSGKTIGKTGGIYFEKTDRVDKLVKLYRLVMLKGNGGDGPENDLEAIIKGIKKYPDHQEIVLIADNNSCVRDMRLLKQIKEPVRVILCGYNDLRGVNPQYIKIAKQTGGSIHTIEYDIQKIHLELEKGSKAVKLMEKDLRVGDLPCMNRKPVKYEYYLNDSIFSDLNQARKIKAYHLHLDLSNKAYTKIPKRIYKIRNALTLDLSKNEISKISKSVYKSPSIRYLDLSGNHISEIPPQMELMSQLRSLDLSDNQIDSLHISFYKLKKLKYLNLANNRISQIPKHFNGRYLEFLYLDHNRLQELPKNISRMKYLRELSLAGNQLEKISKKISYLKKLEVLDLSGNRLKELPATLFRLKKLKILILTDNDFSNDYIELVKKRLPDTIVEWQ